MSNDELEDLDQIQTWLQGNPPIDLVVDRLDSTRQVRDRVETATALMAAWLRDRLHIDEEEDPVAVRRGIATF